MLGEKRLGVPRISQERPRCLGALKIDTSRVILGALQRPRTPKNAQKSSRAPGSARERPGAPGSASRASWETPGAPRERPGRPQSVPGETWERPGSVLGDPRSTPERPGTPGNARERQGAPRSARERPGAPGGAKTDGPKSAVFKAERRWSKWPVGSGRVGPGRAGSRRKQEFATDPLPNAPRKKIRRSGKPLTPT